MMNQKNIKHKIIEFWRWIFEHYKNIEKEQPEKKDKELLSELSELAVFLDEIDEENYKWLMLSAPYVHEGFISPFFIEYLNGLKDKGDREKTAGYIADVFLKMLEHFTPDYDTSHITSIVESLYKAGQKEKADKICNIYGSRDYEFLREIYEKNNGI